MSKQEGVQRMLLFRIARMAFDVATEAHVEIVIVAFEAAFQLVHGE